MNIADDKKLKVIYELLEEEMERDNREQPEEFKTELDKRYEYYENGGKMISASKAEKKFSHILAGRRK